MRIGTTPGYFIIVPLLLTVLCASGFQQLEVTDTVIMMMVMEVKKMMAMILLTVLCASGFQQLEVTHCSGKMQSYN